MFFTKRWEQTKKLRNYFTLVEKIFTFANTPHLREELITKDCGLGQIRKRI